MMHCTFLIYVKKYILYTEEMSSAEHRARSVSYTHLDVYKRQVQELWLTHFSPSLVKAQDYMPQVRKIFENAHLGSDGKKAELIFTED